MRHYRTNIGEGSAKPEARAGHDRSGGLHGVPTGVWVAEAAELLGVSPDTVRRWAGSGKLASQRDSGRHWVIEGAAVELMARLAADAGPTAGHSASNRFSAIVSKVTKGSVMAQVELRADPFRLVSLISREAAYDRGLEAGVVAVASVEAADVTIELPAI